MKYSFLFLLITTCFLSCNPPKKVKEVDDFNKEICAQYEKDFFSKYQKYKVIDIKENGLDYISDYITFCKINGCKRESDYDIIQSYQIYTVKDSIVNSTFDYELIHFFNPEKKDSVIREIMKKNCIDDIILKVNRIYKIGKNTVICVSYSPHFDIADYENFLRSEFNMPISAEIINVSR